MFSQPVPAINPLLADIYEGRTEVMGEEDTVLPPHPITCVTYPVRAGFLTSLR